MNCEVSCFKITVTFCRLTWQRKKAEDPFYSSGVLDYTEELLKIKVALHCSTINPNY